MKKPVLLLFLLLTCAGIYSSNAQAVDSTIKKKPRIPVYLRWVNEESFSHDRVRSYSIDTTRNTIHLVNKAEVSFYNYLANNGSACDPALFSQNSHLYSFGDLSSYRLLFKNSSDIRYFSTNKRYSELSYYAGGRKEQSVRILHSQNLLKTWNIGFDFRRSGAWGYLLNSRTFGSSLDISSWFHTKNNRYQVLTHAIWESVKNEVNGGVKSDSLYDNADLNARELQGLSVKISGAENHVWSRVYSLKQFFDLGPKSRFDTATSPFRYKPTFRLSLGSKLEKYSFAYIDGTHDSDYYENTYYNDSGKDSMFSQSFKNDFAISHTPSDSGSVLQKIYYSLGISWQWYEYRQRSINIAEENTGLFVEIRNAETDTTLLVGGKAEYIAEGVNNGSYDATGFASLPVKGIGIFSLAFTTSRFNPEVYYQNYYSNHFINERKSDPVTFNKSTFRFAVRPVRMEAGINHWQVTNYSYIGYDALPTQFSSSISVLQAYLKKDFTWKSFHFNNTIWYQHTDHDSILHIPSFCSYHALYITVPAFKKALLFETGIDAHFQSEYSGNDFMPSTGFFYLQDQTHTSGYVLFNLFFNFKIKTADIFLKVENTGDLLMTNKYYLVPHYPMQGRTFKFGIRWRFFDQ